MKRLLLKPLEIIADSINWLGEALWRRYLKFTRGYWKRTGLTDKGPFTVKVSILDILSFPFMVALYLGYLFLAIYFYFYVFYYPFLQFANIFAGVTRGVSGAIAIFGLFAWINFVLRRPKKWPFKPWVEIKTVPAGKRLYRKPGRKKDG